MDWYVAALWGAGGSLCYELAVLYSAIQRCKSLPWKVEGEAELPATVMALILHIIFGAFIASAVSSQVTTPLAAIAIAVGADRVLLGLLRNKTSTSTLDDSSDLNLRPEPLPPGAAPDQKRAQDPIPGTDSLSEAQDGHQ